MSAKISQYRKIQWLYIAIDALAAATVWVLFLGYRWLVYDGRITIFSEVLVPAFSLWRSLLLYPFGCLLIYYLSGYYIRPLQHKVGEEFLTTFVSAVIISLSAFFIIIIDDTAETYKRYYFSLLILFGIQLFASWLPRLVITLLVQHFAGKAYGTAIVGDEREAAKLMPQLHDRQSVVVISPSEFDNFHEIKHEKQIQEVIIALGKRAGKKTLYRYINRLYPEHVEISFPARVYDMLTGAARISNLADEPFVTVTLPNMPDWQLCVKRAFDVVMSAAALVILSPLMAYIAVSIKATSKGPVIYRQERIGMYGVPFQILKFRTMVENAETESPQLTAENDPRITSVGHRLRKYRLDEIPQFWNILRGDMSIVGPRPERRYYIDCITEAAPYYCLLYKIRPGLTSWGPIRVGYTDNMPKMIRRLNYDLVYVENMSIGLDLKILFYTVGVIAEGRGR